MTKRHLAVAVVVLSTIADAVSDGIMTSMFWFGWSWDATQWAWHVAKWVSFYPALAWVALDNLGRRSTAVLAVACLILWEVVYSLFT